MSSQFMFFAQKIFELPWHKLDNLIIVICILQRKTNVKMLEKMEMENIDKTNPGTFK